MKPGERIRATYAFQPVDHLVRRGFYIWGEAIEKWKRQGLPDDYEQKNLFEFDPSTNTVAGRKGEREAGRLTILEPGESRRYDLEIGVLTSERGATAIEREIRALVQRDSGEAGYEKRQKDRIHHGWTRIHADHHPRNQSVFTGSHRRAMGVYLW